MSADHEEPRKRPARSPIALRFDEITLAAFVALLIVIAATAFHLGIATSEDRLACGLNDIVNRVLDLQQPCW